MFRSLIALSALAVAGSANAATLFADNFDAHPTGLTVSSLSGWNVAGNVDVVESGSYGISCSGKCIDLDGTTGPGAIATNWLDFAAGQKITVSFDVSGNQRNGSLDQFRFEFNFADATDVLGLTTLSGYPDAPTVMGDFAGLEQIYTEYNVPGADPFITYALSFTPVQAGKFQLSFATGSSDNIGPVLDNVLVSQADFVGGAVPEPATWAMLIAGFGLVGFAARRRRAIAA